MTDKTDFLPSPLAEDELANKVLEDWHENQDDPSPQIDYDLVISKKGDLRLHPIMHWVLTKNPIVYLDAMPYASSDYSTDFQNRAVQGKFIYIPSPETILEAGTHGVSATFIPLNYHKYHSVTETAVLVNNRTSGASIPALLASFDFSLPLVSFPRSLLPLCPRPPHPGGEEEATPHDLERSRGPAGGNFR